MDGNSKSLQFRSVSNFFVDDDNRERNIEIVKRANTFREEKNGWRICNRADFQTPFSFAEAGFVCIGPDKVRCDSCNHTFSDWDITDVPLTEHLKIHHCQFVRAWNVEILKTYPNVKYVLQNNLYSMEDMEELYRENPKIFAEDLASFLSAMITMKNKKEEEEKTRERLLKQYTINNRDESEIFPKRMRTELC